MYRYWSQRARHSSCLLAEAWTCCRVFNHLEAWGQKGSVPCFLVRGLERSRLLNREWI